MRVREVQLGAAEKRSTGNYGSDQREVRITIEVMEGESHDAAIAAGRRVLKRALQEAWAMSPVKGDA